MIAVTGDERFAVSLVVQGDAEFRRGGRGAHGTDLPHPDLRVDAKTGVGPGTGSGPERFYAFEFLEIVDVEADARGHHFLQHPGRLRGLVENDVRRVETAAHRLLQFARAGHLAAHSRPAHQRQDRVFALAANMCSK